MEQLMGESIQLFIRISTSSLHSSFHPSSQFSLSPLALSIPLWNDCHWGFRHHLSCIALVLINCLGNWDYLWSGWYRHCQRSLTNKSNSISVVVEYWHWELYKVRAFFTETLVNLGLLTYVAFLLLATLSFPAFDESWMSTREDQGDTWLQTAERLSMSGLDMQVCGGWWMWLCTKIPNLWCQKKIPPGTSGIQNQSPILDSLN